MHLIVKLYIRGKIMNEQNLIPLNRRTKSEQIKISQKGGKASGEVRREQKRLKRLTQSVLDASVGLNKVSSLNPYIEALIKKKKISLDQALMIGQVVAAIRGSTKAAIFIRDIMGEKPIEQVETYPIDGQLEQEIEERVKQVRQMIIDQEKIRCIPPLD